MILPLLIAAALAPIAVPDGHYVLVNGLLGKGEWQSAITVPLDEQTELRAQKDSSSLFLAIVFKGPHHTGLDLHVKCRDDIRMLHVSSSLSESVFRESKWSDTAWGHNQWWAANPVCVVYEDGKQRVIEPEAFEFQLDRSQLGREVALYFHLKRPEKRLSADASPDTTDHWVRLTLK
jgi:hypothetical protein